MDKGSGGVTRATWGGKVEFFLSCVGYAVGIGNLWRFPYLCMRNGGGAFLIPYGVSIFLCGMPLFFMELSIAQFSSRSPTQVWNFCPLLRGFGWGMLIISASIIFYDLVMTWVLYYLFKSITLTLPWGTCDNEWNTDRCQQLSLHSQGQDWQLACNDSAACNTSASHLHHFTNYTPVSPGEEFFERKVLGLSSGIEDMGGIKLDIFFFFVLSWIITFACMCKGIKSTGKVVYVTATLPYMLLTILLIRGVTLPGALTGIKFFLMPDFSKLLDFRVWVEACVQTFGSLGVGFGGILTMASYNKFDHDFYREAILVPIINHGTSMFGGLVIFSVIGFMAEQTGLPVDEVIKSGPGLAFVVYPEALSKLPLSPLWAVLFFVTLVTVGIDSSFGQVETVASGIEDTFPKLRKYKVPFTACLIFCMFLLGIPFTTKGGMYLFQLFDWYLISIALFSIGLAQCVAVMWIYGHERFYYDIECMLGYLPSKMWKIVCGGITPVVIISCLIYTISSMQVPYYGSYTYPAWVLAFGWFIAAFPLLPVPVCVALAVAKEEGSILERFRKASRPNEEWGPALMEDRAKYKYCKEYTSGVALLHCKA